MTDEVDHIRGDHGNASKEEFRIAPKRVHDCANRSDIHPLPVNQAGAVLFKLPADIQQFLGIFRTQFCGEFFFPESVPLFQKRVIGFISLENNLHRGSAAVGTDDKVFIKRACEEFRFCQ